MAILKNYNGEVLTFPSHTHKNTDTIGLVSSTQDGMMAVKDKTDVENSYTKAFELTNKLKRMIYLSEAAKSIRLIGGVSFNTVLKSVGPNATTITFTKTAIPTAKLAGATLISNENSPSRVYMYLDNTTIFISPEKENDIITAPGIVSGMFSGMTKVKTINLTNFEGNNIVTASNMFNGCSALTNINGLENLNMILCTDMTNMFNGCNNLSATMTISNATIKLFTGMFTNCSTATGAKFVLKYTNAATKAIAVNMVATKSSASKVSLPAVFTATVTNPTWPTWGGGAMYKIATGMTINTSGDIGTLTYSWRVYTVVDDQNTRSIKTTRVLASKTNNVITVDEYKANGLEYINIDSWGQMGYSGHDCIAGYVTIKNVSNGGTEIQTIYVGESDAKKYIPAA